MDEYHYQHKDGRTASIRGAAPWTSEADAANWSTVQVGFTIRHPDGTTGIGKPPFETREAAQKWANEHPKFRGWGSM